MNEHIIATEPDTFGEDQYLLRQVQKLEMEAIS